MNDTTIKGTGNSRAIKTVPNGATLWPTWEAFLSDFCTDGIPIDLLGLISAGVQTSGTPYNKANVLPNTTCSNLGIATSSVPKDAFDRLRTLVQTAQNAANNAQATADAAPKFQCGSYSGTGNSGSSSPTSTTLSFAPKYVAIPHAIRKSDGWILSTGDIWILDVSVLSTSYKRGVGFCQSAPQIGNTYGKKSSDGKTISWYSTGSAALQLNQSDVTYHYFCIG